jgi:choline dehydrogenase-like flavoprotein
VTNPERGNAGDPDVIVIGAGAGGAAVSLRLAERGLRVVCLEQGDWVDRDRLPKRFIDWEVRGRRYWNPNPARRRWPADYPITNLGEHPIDTYFYNTVGGSTVGFGGIYWRLQPSDFRTHSLDGFGVDWPIRYEDLAPYYRQNELIIGMSGLAGDPTGPPREELPTPPVGMDKLGRIWAEAFAKLGWYWWIQDCAITTTSYDGHREGCVGRGFCAFGCPSKSLSTVDVSYWPRALQQGVELRTNARVREITVDTNGLATGVQYYDAEGRLNVLQAPVVVLSGGGLGTPRTLMMSTSAQFPNGLANSSGLVGKNLMTHVQSLVTGLFEEPTHADHGAWGGSVCSRQFYETDPKNDYLRGFTLGGHRGWSILNTALQIAPWGPRHHEVLSEHLNHEGAVYMLGDDDPEESNYVELDWENVDSFGLPGLKTYYTLSENSRNLGEDGIRRAREVCEAAGATSMRDGGLFPVTGWHLMGTARMGADARTSVVDADHRCHDVPNLFIVDASSMPTGGSVNPTNTIQAMALRAADRMVELRSEIPVPLSIGA